MSKEEEQSVATKTEMKMNTTLESNNSVNVVLSAPSSPSLSSRFRSGKGLRKPMDWDEMIQNTIRIWSKDGIMDTVSIDLPRLVRCMKIVDQRSRAYLSRTSSDAHLERTRQEDQVQTVLLTLARLLEDERLVEEIRRQFYEYVRPNSGTERSDIARDIQRFMNEVVGRDTRVVRVLKACNHGIIAPAIIQLKKNICPHLNFKDGGGWLIRITVRDDEVLVQHNKREKQMRTDGQKEDYEFEWQYQIHFTKDALDLKQVSFHITDLSFSKEAPPEIVQDAKETFQDYLVVNQHPQIEKNNNPSS